MDDKQVNMVWDQVLEALRLVVSAATFKTFFSHVRMVGVERMGEITVATLACNTSMVKDTVEKKYRAQICEEIARITKSKIQLRLVVQPVSSRQEPVEQAGTLFEPNVKDDNRWKMAGLRADYTFDWYAVGGSNQLAFAAAQAVARKPGLAYNPLFIYGGVGVGKTHLMQAIGHEVVKSGELVRCCTGEEFTNDLVEAIRYKTTDKVRSKYRRVKLLLIDDVQFIAGKPSVQEEFFHTFNAINKEGGQIVMTSDRPPSEISRLEERLKSRFGAGLIVDVGQPDFELRTAILLIKAKQLNIPLSMEVAQEIAQAVEGVRELQGVLVRLSTEENKGWVGDAAKVRAIIGKPREKLPRLVPPQRVINIISNFYGVSLAQLKGERRTKSLVWPRQVAMYFLVREMKMSQEEVGRLLGGRDHTTVIHARDKVAAAISTNEQVRREFELLREQVARAE